MTFWKKTIFDLSETLWYLFLFERIFLGGMLLRVSSSFIKTLIIYLPKQSHERWRGRLAQWGDASSEAV